MTLVAGTCISLSKFSEYSSQMHLSTNLGMGKSFNWCIGPSIRQIFSESPIQECSNFSCILRSHGALSRLCGAWLAASLVCSGHRAGLCCCLAPGSGWDPSVQRPVWRCRLKCPRLWATAALLELLQEGVWADKWSTCYRCRILAIAAHSGYQSSFWNS